ncbi:MAG: NAD(P)-dependent oxidoreductase [Bacillota bacterium]|nr:NAD(P)-dependent oxidoreductase [Bacillota bacterium]
METIGFIGLGRMGSGICQNIINAGHEVLVFDEKAEAMHALKGTFQQAADIGSVLEKSAVIFLCLPGSIQVEAVAQTFLNGQVAGKTIIDLSTSFPLSSKKLYEQYAAAGASFADASLNGSPVNAAQGSLIITFGGDRDVYDRLQTLFACFSKEVLYMGPAGSGNLAKLACNYLAINYAVLYAEIFPLLEKLGVDLEQFFETIGHTGVDCGIYRYYAPKIIDKSYKPGFALELALKDATYVKQLFETFQAPAFLLEGCLNLLRTSVKDGKATHDLSECADTMRQYLKIE